MKIILITQRTDINEKTGEERNALALSWGPLFSRLGFLPVILPAEYDFRKYFDEFNIAGVLLTGGNDLHEISGNEIDKKRDEHEFELLKYCVNNSIAVLGICRGMQVIASYFNGEVVSVDKHAGTRHEIKIYNSSKYLTDYKNNNVNSYHNYGMYKVPDGFKASAICPTDNVIEAMEHESLKIYAQMWHPERELPFNNDDIKILKDFWD